MCLAGGQILFRGEPTRVRVETTHSRSTGNLVRMVDSAIVVSHWPRSRTPVARNLELWLRRQARQANGLGPLRCMGLRA
jgi:hypothetical protein